MKEVVTYFKNNLVPVGVGLIVDGVRGTEFLGDLDKQGVGRHVQNLTEQHLISTLTASFSSEPEVMIVYR